MAPFRFQLETVLEFRRALEEQAMQTLAAAIMRRDSVKERLTYIEAELMQQREKLCRAASLTAAERWLVQTYETALKEDKHRAVAELAECEEEIDLCREDVVKKSQERQLLEKLKEKQAARHTRQERLTEQRVYDETATLRYAPVSL